MYTQSLCLPNASFPLLRTLHAISTATIQQQYIIVNNRLPETNHDTIKQTQNSQTVKHINIQHG